MQTTSILLTTSLFAALASAQKTVVFTGEPKQLLPTFSLNPTESAIVSKYVSDVVSALDAPPTASFNLPAYLNTASALPTGLDAAITAVLEGEPIPTGLDTDIPSSLRDPLNSFYNGVASVAKSDLTADPALSTIAHYYVVPPEATSTPKITEVIATTKPSRSVVSGHAVASSGFATTTSAAGSGVARSSGAASGTGIVAASGSGVSGVLSSTGGSAPASTSPITSAKASSGASAQMSLSMGAGALVAVGLGFVALL